VNSLDLLPPTASTYASQLNYFFWVMVTICGIVATGIALFIIYCAIKYHRRSPTELPPQSFGNIKAEATWTVVPLIIFLGMFGWGAKTYFDAEQPPPETLNIWVLGKQWMWEIQHPNGTREINTLHIPIYTPVRLTMISEDVIHDFFVPAFRIKQDVLPMRYMTIWFNATRPGKYHLFCAEYCGAKHSGMIGWVYAMNPNDYQVWLGQGGGEGSLAATGQKLFLNSGCANCHRPSGHGPGPSLERLYGTPVTLATGAVRIADESYIRECILGKKGGPVAGFTAIMPNYSGRLSEKQIIALVSYIKAIGPETDLNQPSSSGNTRRDYSSQPGIAAPGSTSISGTIPESR